MEDVRPMRIFESTLALRHPDSERFPLASGS